MRRLGSAVLGFMGLAVTLAGCETAPPARPPVSAPVPFVPPPPPPPPPGPPPFRPGELAWSTARGANALTGIVSFRPGPRDRWTCAESLSLVPDGRYSRQRMAQVYGATEEAIVPVGEARRRSAEAGPAAYQQFVRRTPCTPQGRFAFRGLPDGSYFLLALARPAKPRPGVEGVAILEHVILQGGFAKQVIVPRPR